MTKHPTPPPATNKDARNALVMSALRLFAEKGYEAATTRDICEAAGANISAIRYYFGDKAGLYRAAFTEPLGEMPCGKNFDQYAHLPLNQAFDLFFSDFLAPLKMGEKMGLLMKLRFREMVEPTGVWQDETDAEIKPQHEALVALLIQHLGLEQVDIDVQRLALAIIGMAVHYFVGQDVIVVIAPDMLSSAQAVDTLALRLSAYALAMVAYESERRNKELSND